MLDDVTNNFLQKLLKAFVKKKCEFWFWGTLSFYTLFVKTSAKRIIVHSPGF